MNKCRVVVDCSTTVHPVCSCEQESELSSLRPLSWNHVLKAEYRPAVTLFLPDTDRKGQALPEIADWLERTKKLMIELFNAVVMPEPRQVLWRDENSTLLIGENCFAPYAHVSPSLWIHHRQAVIDHMLMFHIATGQAVTMFRRGETDYSISSRETVSNCAVQQIDLPSSNDQLMLSMLHPNWEQFPCK